MYQLLRDTPLGVFLNIATRGNLCKYPEEQEGLSVTQWGLSNTPAQNKPIAGPGSCASTVSTRLADESQTQLEGGTLFGDPATEKPDLEAISNGGAGQPLQNASFLVDFYGPEDRANPKNWSGSKKAFVYLTINYVNAAAYMGSSIVAASQPGIMDEFQVSETVASLMVALFVLGYGLGALIFSPLADMAMVGRNWPYLGSMVILIVLSVLAATATNITGILILRFLQGIVACPALSFGGASLSDICSDNKRPLALYTWACSGFAAASLAPVISGFAVPVLGWRWPLWEIVLAAGPALVLLLLLPETSHSKILYDRAQRLRTLRPDLTFKTPNEKNHTSLGSLLWKSFVVPWQMHALDPSIFFTSVYTGVMYASYYSFFEVFPLVYEDIYGFNMGETGLIYLAIVTGVVLIGIPYCGYIYYYVTPAIARGAEFPPEFRLLPAVFASMLVPAGLFLFAWTARAEVHFMVPTIGAGLTTSGMVVTIQCIFVYISLGYPHYAASAFGGNGFLRAMIAFGGLLWSRPLYAQVGVAGGTSILGGICTLGVLGMFLLYKYGAKLRMRSRFAA